MKKKQVNENYIHNSDLCQKIDLTNCIRSITEMNFKNEELMQIINFYLYESPFMIKENDDNKKFGLKTFVDYGWKGNSALNKLESRLLNSSNIGTFCIIKADTISETLQNMNLDDKICIEHPRAVLKQQCSVKINENGTTTITPKESRMICLFRHIRNSIAHNRTYLFKNDNIMIEDIDDKKNVSARILMPKVALFEWINIVTKGPTIKNEKEIKE